MIYNLSAHHNIHYFQAAVYASCYTGADDTDVYKRQALDKGVLKNIFFQKIKSKNNIIQ